MSQFALLIIDVQSTFADPVYDRGNGITRRASEKIASLAPAFRAAGVPIHAVYSNHGIDAKPADEIDFYKFKPAPQDILCGKTSDSAFETGRTALHLQDQGCKTLFIAGFNTNACIRETVIDACKAGYQVHVMTDLIGNSNYNKRPVADALAAMQAAGAIMTTSENVLQTLLGQNPITSQHQVGVVCGVALK